ncbi:50S ribosomal protein L24 [Candidatus Shapirobacteria bacterium CG03_land_8_20_14_0_80_39_12]|uniref:Large ribosomal subunit protein uL24 n=1 Tax=Candidatus Shapirobacteria bacterium CG03_land_8_20_14_0_80_39_12 TaxID=1974879 RepID=A0A2M7BEM3_9BACT|nr:MAG: 50S ribosomal protein L24 [Candidatus Shapirobacteria bacterium CG03_land_8_20_14_0_80_39_12]
MKLKKGDKVKVMLGKDRGKTGTIDRVFNKEGLVLVSGVNLYKRHLKPRSEQDQSSGGIVDKVRPLNLAKVALICPQCGKITRVGFLLGKGMKVRICKICKAEI